jgi:hypothetical protein
VKADFKENPRNWMPLRMRHALSTSLRMLLAAAQVIYFILVLVVNQVYPD